MAKYKPGDRVEYRGVMYTLIKYRYREYSTGRDWWDAENDVQELYLIGLGGIDHD